MTKKWSVGLTFCFLIILLGLLWYPHALIKRFVFQPSKLQANFEFRQPKPQQEFYIPTNDGNRIHGVWYKVTQAKGAILYFHGNRGDLSRWGPMAATYMQYGYDVYVIDYRGYGKSSGFASEVTMYEDARYLHQFYKSRQSYDKTIYVGRSLGSGIAAHLSQNNPPDALILETPYYSISNLIKRYLFWYEKYPDRPADFPTFRFLEGHTFPVLILHGTNDRVIPLDEAKKLKASLNDSLSYMTIIQHGDHHNFYQYAAYARSLQAFLK